jgi:hypothetical protein
MIAKWDLDDEDAMVDLLSSHACLMPTLDALVELFSSIDLEELDESKPSTPQIRAKVEGKLARDGWSQKVLITDDFPSGVNRANYEVDFQLQMQCPDCRLPHQISLELAFDNRQAVGSNLLKMDSANLSFVDTREGVSLSIIVVTTAVNRDSGKWDNAVAIDHDYSWALRKAYRRYFKTPIMLLTIS